MKIFAADFEQAFAHYRGVFRTQLNILAFCEDS